MPHDRIPGLAGSLTIRLELDDELCKGYSAAEREFLGRSFELVQCAHGVRWRQGDWACGVYEDAEQFLTSLRAESATYRVSGGLVDVYAERAAFLDACADITEEHIARLWPADL